MLQRLSDLPLVLCGIHAELLQTMCTTKVIGSARVLELVWRTLRIHDHAADWVNHGVLLAIHGAAVHMSSVLVMIVYSGLTLFYI
jgi:hypothetical protein